MQPTKKLEKQNLIEFAFLSFSPCAIASIDVYIALCVLVVKPPLFE